MLPEQIKTDRLTLRRFSLQDADAVFLLYRENKYDTAGSVIETRLDVAKNRNGPTPSFPLAFHEPTMRFTTMAKGA